MTAPRNVAEEIEAAVREETTKWYAEHPSYSSWPTPAKRVFDFDVNELVICLRRGIAIGRRIGARETSASGRVVMEQVPIMPRDPRIYPPGPPPQETHIKLPAQPSPVAGGAACAIPECTVRGPHEHGVSTGGPAPPAAGERYRARGFGVYEGSRYYCSTGLADGTNEEREARACHIAAALNAAHERGEGVK